MRRFLAPILALGLAGPAMADALTITQTVVAVSDPLNNLVPRSIPQSVADYKIVATNPLANAFQPVKNVVVLENLPAGVILRVLDIAAAGKGPLEFSDGSLLGTGLLSSGLTYTYSTMSPATDSVEFSDGTSWSYQPVADADGYDSKVRAIRVTLGSTFATSTSFQLRYRVKIK